MDIDTQIEKLSKDIFDNCHAGLFEDEAELIAQFVIEKRNYRPASEVAEDIIRMLRAAGINEWRYPIVADIKKKYTEEHNANNNH